MRVSSHSSPSVPFRWAPTNDFNRRLVLEYLSPGICPHVVCLAWASQQNKGVQSLPQICRISRGGVGRAPEAPEALPTPQKKERRRTVMVLNVAFHLLLACPVDRGGWCLTWFSIYHALVAVDDENLEVLLLRHAQKVNL